MPPLLSVFLLATLLSSLAQAAQFKPESLAKRDYSAELEQIKEDLNKINEALNNERMLAKSNSVKANNATEPAKNVTVDTNPGISKDTLECIHKVSKAFQLTDSDMTHMLNGLQPSDSLDSILTFLQDMCRQQIEATRFSETLTLSKSIVISTHLFFKNLADLQLDQRTLDAILNARPNYNYLYSTYSKRYHEPFVIFISTPTTNAIVKFLYGPELNKLDENEATNKVDDAVWLRSKACTSNNNTTNSTTNQAGRNDLLRGMSSSAEKAVCSLADSQLVSLFVYISKKIDFTKVKRLVYRGTSISDPSFLDDAIDAFTAYSALQQGSENKNLIQVESTTTSTTTTTTTQSPKLEAQSTTTLRPTNENTNSSKIVGQGENLNKTSSD